MIDQSSFMGRAVSLDDQATIYGVSQNSTTAFRLLEGTMQISDVVYYRTSYWFMGFGVLATLIVIALIITSYWRYGEIGRNVTLGPVEVASAFRAPILTEGRDNAAEAGGDIRELIKDVGHRKVMSGFVDETQDHTEDHLPRRSRTVRMGISDPQSVRPASGVWSGPGPSTLRQAPTMWNKHSPL